MPRNFWANKCRFKFLVASVARYNEAQKGGNATLSQFWTEFMDEWIIAFPQDAQIIEFRLDV